MATNAAGNRYFKHGGNYGGRVGQSAIICGGDDGNDVRYDIEPLTEETMDTYYFGATASEKMLTEDGTYLTTMYTAFPYKCYDGVKAYYVSAVKVKNGEGSLVCKEIESGLVPSNTAVILECKGTDAKQNRLVPQLEEPAAIEGNLLKGVIDLDDGNDEESYRTKVTDNMRVLSVKDEKIGFYKYDATYLTSNKAYIELTDEQAGAKQLTLTFDDYETIATGIEQLKPERPRMERQGWYTLQGVKVDEPLTPGIYIHNGKKVMVGQ